MNARRKGRGKYGLNWVTGVVVISLMLILAALLRLQSFEKVESLFLNGLVNRMELPPIEDKLIVILGTDRSISEVGMWPWPRDTYVKLLDGPLKTARTVALDILFVDESPSGDDALADAFDRHGNVVLCYAEAEPGKAALHSLPMFIKTASGEGFSNAMRDDDGIARRYRLIEQGQIFAPSFMCATALLSGYYLDWDYSGNGALLHVTSPDGKTRSMPVDREMQFIRFSAPKNQIKTYELSDVLNGRIPAEEFNGAIVVVGFNASGVADVVSSADGLVSGTQYNVDSLYTLISGVNPVRAPVILDAVLVLVLFLLSIFLTSKFRIHISFLSPSGLILAWYIAVNALFLQNIIWLSSFLPTIAILVGYAFNVIITLIRSQHDLHVRTLSMDSLLSLSYSLSNTARFKTFTEYLNVLSGEIRSATGVEIIDPVVYAKKSDLTRFNMQNETDGLRIAYNAGSRPLIHEILVSLPPFGEDTEDPRYSLLGMRSKVPVATIRSVAALIVTSHVYFFASKATAERSDMFYSMIRCMVSAIDAKDPVTSGHSHRVSEISEQIARLLGLPEPDVEQIRFSGMIHDIGKIGIPDSVLGKPGPFSGTDFKLMQQHPLKGVAIMEPITLSSEILDGVLYHHERIDGKGYPCGKSGDELSLTPRIIKVADVYDALCSERQYKKAWPLDRVLNILYEGRGTEFDSDVVDVFIESIKPDGWLPPSGHFSPSGAPNAFVLKKYKYVIRFFQNKVKESKLQFNTVNANNDGKVDLVCRDSFYSVDWYESYRGEGFLRMRPQLLYAGEDITMFALPNNNGPVVHTLYYFLREFLAAGALMLNSDPLQQLTEIFGDPTYTDEDIVLWDKGRMAVILAKEQNASFYTVFYITKCVLDE